MRELTQQEIDNAPDWATQYLIDSGRVEYYSVDGINSAYGAKPIPRKPFDIGKYDDEMDGIHPCDSPYIGMADGELRVDGVVQKCHAIAIAKHFKLI